MGAAVFCSLYEIPNKKNPLRSKVSNLLQRVLLRGQRNRIYHKELRQATPTKLYCQSTELPVDWLVYYDAVSRVCRDPTELYGFILKSVPYLILRDRTKRESYYHSSTQDFTADELIPSESLHVTVCHSSRTNNSLQNQTIFRRNIFLPNIQCPFVKNLSIPGSCGKSVIFSHLVGFHSSRQNID